MKIIMKNYDLINLLLDFLYVIVIKLCECYVKSDVFGKLLILLRELDG